MTPVEMSVLLKPLVMFVFFAVVVLPIEWLLFKVFPNGQLKTALFRPRTGNRALPDDRGKWIASVVLANVLLWTWIAFVASQGP